MTRSIGLAGRQAAGLAQSVTSARRAGVALHSRAPLMRVATSDADESVASDALQAAGAGGAALEIEREAGTPSVQDVAERVYRIFCQNLRLERERRGRWE